QPESLVRRGRQEVNNLVNLMSTIPRDVSRLFKDARRGKMRVDLDLKRLDDFGRRLDDTIDRITIGIMTASLVIGSSIVMTIKGGPEFFGIPVLTALGLLGYVIAFFNSVWIIVSIWRANRS
ncbi:MAG: ubiquinone biosynthesis protein UbiB, partial [Gammaproteobacteria bacterium]|nr:ubiquinone biosynthesis protein UbiB [Gammaproteobacteria bacterium]